MSYYESNYYQNPGPVYGGSDKDEPVPGWGPLPNMAGPARVGVGQVQPVPLHDKIVPPPQNGAPGAKRIPWWGWALGAVVVAGGIAVVVTRK